jgi:hypothetical protein
VSDESLSPRVRLMEALFHLEQAQEQIDSEHPALAVEVEAISDDIEWVATEMQRAKSERPLD